MPGQTFLPILKVFFMARQQPTHAFRQYSRFGSCSEKLVGSLSLIMAMVPGPLLIPVTISLTCWMRIRSRSVMLILHLLILPLMKRIPFLIPNFHCHKEMTHGYDYRTHCRTYAGDYRFNNRRCRC